MTVFRLLRELPYRRSYNCNGRYYTAFDPARFDHFGLWRFREIRFSTDGSLKATVLRMVLEAQAGLTHPELADRLGVRVHNTLLGLTRAAAIGRQAVDRVFVYLHPDPARREEQLRRRRERATATATTARSAREVELSDRVVIAVLLALLRAPGASVPDVVRGLRGHAPPISSTQIQAVFARYDLEALGEKGGPSHG
jgi:hypothetical protein